MAHRARYGIGTRFPIPKVLEQLWLVRRFFTQRKRSLLATERWDSAANRSAPSEAKAAKICPLERIVRRRTCPANSLIPILFQHQFVYPVGVKHLMHQHVPEHYIHR